MTTSTRCRTWGEGDARNLLNATRNASVTRYNSVTDINNHRGNSKTNNDNLNKRGKKPHGTG
jgi:hypothetical protein